MAQQQQYPNYYQQQQQQQQPQVQASTLAPLIEMPKASDYQNLASQPADLAQPLPEYGKTQVELRNFNKLEF